MKGFKKLNAEVTGNKLSDVRITTSYIVRETSQLMYLVQINHKTLLYSDEELKSEFPEVYARYLGEKLLFKE